ncbi:MAG: hypothetical protein ACKO5F_05020 [Synechococcus sp.]
MRDRLLAVHSEVAAVGQGGLQINEPGNSRSLKTLPGDWSDLALACLIHVGMKRLMPDEDSGLGIGAEYEEAVRLLAQKVSNPETMHRPHSFDPAAPSPAHASRCRVSP